MLLLSHTQDNQGKSVILSMHVAFTAYCQAPYATRYSKSDADCYVNDLSWHVTMLELLLYSQWRCGAWPAGVTLQTICHDLELSDKGKTGPHKHSNNTTRQGVMISGNVAWNFQRTSSLRRQCLPDFLPRPVQILRQPCEQQHHTLGLCDHTQQRASKFSNVQFSIYSNSMTWL